MKYYFFIFQLKYVLYFNIFCNSIFSKKLSSSNVKKKKKAKKSHNFLLEKKYKQLKEELLLINFSAKKKIFFTKKSQINNIFYSLKVITILLYFFLWDPHINKFTINSINLIIYIIVFFLNILIFFQFSFYKKLFFIDFFIGLSLTKHFFKLSEYFLIKNSTYLLLVIYLIILNGLYFYQNKTFIFFYQWFFIQMIINALLLPLIKDIDKESWTPLWIFINSFIITKFLLLNYITILLNNYLLKNILKFLFIITFGLVFFYSKGFLLTMGLNPTEIKKILLFNIFFIFNNIFYCDRNFIQFIFYYLNIDCLIYYYCYEFFLKNEENNNNSFAKLYLFFKEIEKYSLITKDYDIFTMYNKTFLIIKDLLKILKLNWLIENELYKQIINLIQEKNSQNDIIIYFLCSYFFY